MIDTKSQYYYALGRRKTASAKVRIQAGKGQITINQKPAEDYFNKSQPLLAEIIIPLTVVDQAEAFNVSIIVKGGGHHAQVGAIKLGLAKALIEVNAEYKDTLRKAQLLGRDPRAKERKKFGLKGARKQRQFTKR